MFALWHQLSYRDIKTNVLTLIHNNLIAKYSYCPWTFSINLFKNFFAEWKTAVLP